MSSGARVLSVDPGVEGGPRTLTLQHAGRVWQVAWEGEALRPGDLVRLDASGRPTERVFAQTRERLEEHGLRMAVLPTLHDVDRPEDLEDLVDRLEAGSDRSLAVRTRAWAARHGVGERAACS